MSACSLPLCCQHRHAQQQATLMGKTQVMRVRPCLPIPCWDASMCQHLHEACLSESNKFCPLTLVVAIHITCCSLSHQPRQRFI